MYSNQTTIYRFMRLTLLSKLDMLLFITAFTITLPFMENSTARHTTNSYLRERGTMMRVLVTNNTKTTGLQKQRNLNLLTNLAQPV